MPDICKLETIMSWHIFNHEVIDFIVLHCDMNPFALHNQLAVTCRATNLRWRRLHRQMVLVRLRQMVMQLIDVAGSNFVIRHVAFPLQDLVDIIWKPGEDSVDPWPRHQKRNQQDAWPLSSLRSSLVVLVLYFCGVHHFHWICQYHGSLSTWSLDPIATVG